METCNATATEELTTLDELEKQGLQMQAFSLENLTLVQDRAYRLLGMLLAGAGGIGVLALSRTDQVPPITAALIAASVWWFLLAAGVCWRCLLSQEIPSVAGDPLDWLKHRDALGIYRQELINEGHYAPNIKVLLQHERLKAISARAATYRDLSAPRWQALDMTYKLAVATPLVCLAAGAVCYWMS